MLDAPGTMRKSDLPADIERVCHSVIGGAIEVHRLLGPGLLERHYERALHHELDRSGLRAERQVEIRVPYKDILLDSQVLDLVVEGRVVIELKSIDEIMPVHKAQLLSYLRLADLPVGLLINFNKAVLKDGLHRILNERSSHLALASSRPSRLRVQND